MNRISRNSLEKIQKLVGSIDEEQLHHVDYFIGEEIGMFMPVTGPCYYAVTPLHTHPTYMFVLTFNDQTALIIGDCISYHKQGTLSALSPEIPHHEILSETPPRYIAIFIDKEFFEEQLAQYPVQQPVIFNGEYYEVPPNFLNVLKEFMIEADNKIPGYNSLIYAISLKVCHQIIRTLFNFNYIEDRVTYRLEIDKTIEFMHSNLGEKINVEKLAQIANMSPSYYARIFKKETGKTCICYLNEVRLEKVKKRFR